MQKEKLLSQCACPSPSHPDFKLCHFIALVSNRVKSCQIPLKYLGSTACTSTNWSLMFCLSLEELGTKFTTLLYYCTLLSVGLLFLEKTCLIVQLQCNFQQFFYTKENDALDHFYADIYRSAEIDQWWNHSAGRRNFTFTNVHFLVINCTIRKKPCSVWDRTVLLFSISWGCVKAHPAHFVAPSMCINLDNKWTLTIYPQPHSQKWNFIIVASKISTCHVKSIIFSYTSLHY